jgi:ParE-like toxin of type II ParDE toxin-antitoxin system
VSCLSQPEVPRVAWTPEADADLQLIVKDPAVREEVKRNAETTLHDIEAFSGQDRRSEGSDGEIMWHRAWNHKHERRASWLPEQADEGPWNYVLFYRSTVGPGEFEVLAVRSRIQIADRIWGHLQSRSSPRQWRRIRRLGRRTPQTIPRHVLGRPDPVPVNPRPADCGSARLLG